MSHTGSILVVDSEPTIVELLVELLTDEGYVVYSAQNGVGALAVIAHQHLSLMLLDVWAPGMNGTEVIAQLHAADLATMPIVLMTTSPHDAAPLLGQGSMECLAKPFDLDDVLACVVRYVQPILVADELLMLSAT
jgi:CheY-like chemotaxis protein